MSSEQDRIRELAERIARRLDSSGPETRGSSRDAGSDGDATDDVTRLRAGLSEIQSRLAYVESHIAHDESHGTKARGLYPSRPTSTQDAYDQSGERPGVTPVRSTWLSGVYVPAVAHPSQEKFNSIGEAVSELVDFFESEKTCSVEPGNKPCDHCGACSARGF